MHQKKKMALAQQRHNSMHAVAHSKAPTSAEVFYHNAAGGVNVHQGPNPWHNADAATTGITDTGSSASVPTPPFVDPSQIPVDTTAAASAPAPSTTPAPCGCGHENHKMVCFGAGVVVGVVLALLLTRAD